MKGKYIRIFECCRLVRGWSRSLFVDLQRKSYRFFPNELLELLVNANGNTVCFLKALYKNKFDDVIDQNLAILEKEEFIFYTDVPELFPSMNLQWDAPTGITNAVIDLSKSIQIYIDYLLLQLSDLGCEHVQLRVVEFLSLNDLQNLLDLVGKRRIISIEIIMPIDNHLSEQDYIDFVWNNPRIFSLIIHSARLDKQIYSSPSGMGHIYFSTTCFDGSQHCGKVDLVFFSVNINSFTESIYHNSCLNRKLSIDVEGNIKNCPSMSESFGNIADTTLAEAIEKPGFKKYWNINKNKIHVCKDCEFRYICTDCRAYVEDPEDILSKPLKCGYNPYTGEWSEWSTNPLKQKAIDFYGMRDLVESRQTTMNKDSADT